MNKTYDELLEECAKLREENAFLRKLVDNLQKRVEDLEARLAQNSKNSSNPPSSYQKPNLPPPNSGTNSKSRPYHHGASRVLLPETAVTSREIRAIDTCPRCRSRMERAGEVRNWQTIELPEIRPLVQQIELYTCVCPKCRLVQSPELRQGEQFLLGPRLDALVSLCLGQFRHSHRSVRDFLATLIPDLHLSQGVISKIKRRAALALDEAHELITQSVLDSKHALHVDVTGGRHRGRNEHATVLRSANLVSFSLEETVVFGNLHDGIRSSFIDKHRMDRGEIAASTWRQYGYFGGS